MLEPTQYSAFRNSPAVGEVVSLQIVLIFLGCIYNIFPYISLYESETIDCNLSTILAQNVGLEP